jgi:hypothetical protein
MTRIVEERKEIRRVLQRLSAKNLERLRNYAVHLEIEEKEEKEPPLTSDEEDCISISRAQIARGEGQPCKDVLNELW